MANRFLNNITINDSYTLPSVDGTADQLIATDGAGQLSFIDPSAISVGESEQVHIACKNTSGVAISKGDPVYITGTVGTSYRIEIAKADASDSAKMPAVGLAETDLAINAEGFVIVSGVLKNITTDPLSTGDGTPSSNDTVYVKVGGGLTRTKPTGAANLIQNVGKVSRVQSTSAGSIAVSTIMRTNDVPNLTTGKIWVGSSTYTTESTVVHLDETNGRMGIGTTSPDTELHVEGNLLVDAYNVGEDNGIFLREGFLTIDQPSITVWDMSNSGASPDGLSLNAQDGIRFRENGGEVARFKDGNFGIGITSPSEKLEVAGNIVQYPPTGTGGYLKLGQNVGANDVAIELGEGRTTSGVSRIDFIGDTTYTDYGFRAIRHNSGANATSQLVHRGTGNFELVSQDSGDIILNPNSGNVGIGTTSPAAKLSVNGTTQLDGEVSLPSTGTATASVNYPSQTLRFTTSAWDTNNSVARDVHWNIRNEGTSTVYPDGTLTFYEESPSFNHWKLKLPGRGSGSTYIHPDAALFNGRVNIYESDTSNVNISLHPSGDSYFNGGNVGIGTISPIADAKLVIHNGNVDLEFSVDNAIADTARIFAYDRTANAHRDLQLRGNELEFFTGSAERMRIDSGGNVGIGTTSPGNKLSIVTGAGQDDTIPALGSNGGKFSLLNNGGLYGLLAGVLGNGNSFLQTQRVDSTATAYNMLLNPNGGNVGIGTTSPLAKFHVQSGGLGTANGNYQFNALFQTQNSNSEILEIKSVRTAAGTDWTTAGKRLQMRIDSTYMGYMQFNGNSNNYGISFGTGSTTSAPGNVSEKMRITSAGNVGIGTTSPSQKLHVSGNARVTGAYYDSNNSAGTSGQILSSTATGTDWIDVSAGGIDGSGTASYIPKWSDSDTITDSVIYENLTYIGIGNTNPLDKLHVTGTVRAVSPSASNWAFLGLNSAGFASSGIWFDSGDGELLLRDDSSNLNVRLRSDADSYINGGKVGIGTSSPAAKLDVDTVGTNTTAIRASAGTNTQFAVGIDGTNNGLVQVAGNDGVARVYLNGANSGSSYFTEKLGIGTTSPNAKLDVNGSGNFSGGTVVSGIDTQTDVGISVAKGSFIKSNDGNYLRNIIGHTTGANIEIGQGGTALINDITLRPGSSGNISFFTTGSEAIRFASNGNVGVGTTSPAAKLDIDSVGSSATGLRVSAGSTTQFSVGIDGTNNGQLTVNANSGTAAIKLNSVGSSYFNGGNVGIGTTTPSHALHVNKTVTSSVFSAYFQATSSGYGSTNIRVDNVAYGAGIRFYRGGTYGATACSFMNGTSQVGRIDIGTSSTSYVTNSDYRLKENVIELADGIERVKQLQPKRFNFIGETKIVDGFIAHEAQEVVPEAITGEKDGVLPNGEPDYQGIDQAKLVPLLTAALQEAITKIEQLETRIQTLENN